MQFLAVSSASCLSDDHNCPNPTLESLRSTGRSPVSKTEPCRPAMSFPFVWNSDFVSWILFPLVSSFPCRPAVFDGRAISQFHARFSIALKNSHF